MTAYTLHSGATYGLSSSGDTGAFTLGVQFSVSQSMSLTGIWFYSGSGTTVLPTACALYNANTGAQIAGTLNSSPTWSGAAGSGWVKCTYSGPTLSSGINYVAAVYATASPTYFFDAGNYWTAGGGSAGLTNGPLSAPNSAGAVNGQSVYNSGTGITFPASTVSGFDFGVDVEVSTIAAAPAQPNQPRATVPVPRRTPARASWQALAGPANAHGGNGTVQPRATVPAPRRTAGRAVTRGTVVSTVNAIVYGPAGTVQPRATVRVPRRYPARAVWRGPAAVTTTDVLNPAGQQPHGFVSSRRPVGGLWGGLYTPQANAPQPASGTVQPHVVIPRRTAARAVTRGTVTSTANAAPPVVTPAPAQKPPARRRTSSRGQWRGTVTSTANASGPAVPAPKQRPRVTSRAPARGAWKGTITIGADAVAPAVTFTYGIPYFEWDYGTPHF